MEDFSDFLAARRQRDRTDQYLILAALFCRGGKSTAVTSREISDTLKLHLGKKAPDHIQTRLREYAAYVRITSQGPPLTWTLKDKGVQHLRELSGLPLEDAAEQPQFETDVGVICAMEQPEFAAVEDAFGGSENWKLVEGHRFAHLYRSCNFQTKEGDQLSVVGTTSTSMGLTAASIVTTQLIMQFRPRIIMIVGIAAGTRDGGKEFGDVLVADPSVDYNSGKVVWSNGVRGFLPDPYPIGLNPRLRTVLRRFQGDNQAFREIQDGWNGPLPSTPNRMHLGPVGAADQVIDDATRILEIQRSWRKLIGVEMETYGVYRACHESPEPKPRFVSFKSVCDFAAEKSDSWQDYAAYVAAQFAARFLRSQWHSLWSKPSATGGKQ